MNNTLEALASLLDNPSVNPDRLLQACFDKYGSSSGAEEQAKPGIPWHTELWPFDFEHRQNEKQKKCSWQFPSNNLFKGMLNLGFFFCYIYLLGSTLDSIKAEASPSARTHLMDCLSTVQHFKHISTFGQIGQKIKKNLDFWSHCCIVIWKSSASLWRYK